MTETQTVETLTIDQCEDASDTASTLQKLSFPHRIGSHAKTDPMLHLMSYVHNPLPSFNIVTFYRNALYVVSIFKCPKLMTLSSSTVQNTTVPSTVHTRYITLSEEFEVEVTREEGSKRPNAVKLVP